MDKTIECDDIAETFQHIVDEVIYVWNEIKEIVKKAWENLKTIIQKSDKLYKYIKRYIKCKKHNKKSHYFKKILKILKE